MLWVHVQQSKSVHVQAADVERSTCLPDELPARCCTGHGSASRGVRTPLTVVSQHQPTPPLCAVAETPVTAQTVWSLHHKRTRFAWYGTKSFRMTFRAR
jgi:hypothetical protein